MKQETLPIAGYRSPAIPNGLIRQESPSTRLAVLFPGLGYRNTMPVLYYPRQLLLSKGYDVLTIDYAYDQIPEFRALPEAEKLAWIEADARHAVDAFLSLGGYEHYTLVGKSLGTAAIAYTVPEEPRLASADLVLLTPGFKTLGVPERLARCTQRSFLAIGTADPHYEAVHVDAARARGAEVILVPGLDHGLEKPGDVVASVAAMRNIMERLSAWLGAVTR